LVLQGLACQSAEKAGGEQVQPPVVQELIEEVTAVDFLRPKKLVFAVTPYFSAQTLKAEFEPLVKYLGEQLGLPVEFRFTESYSDMIALIGGPDIHIAVLSPLSYVRAKEANPELRLLATQIANGGPTYSAYIVTRADRGFTSIEDLRGKRFGFVDEQSTSGYLYALAWMQQRKLVPKDFFSEIVYTGDHEKLIQMVASGKIDGGATSSSAYRIARLENLDDEAISILAKTGRIPYDAVVANPRLDPEMVAKIRQLILGLSTRVAEGRRVLGGPTNINGFVPADDSLYEDVRDALSTLNDK